MAFKQVVKRTVGYRPEEDFSQVLGASATTSVRPIIAADCAITSGVVTGSASSALVEVSGGDDPPRSAAWEGFVGVGRVRRKGRGRSTGRHFRAWELL